MRSASLRCRAVAFCCTAALAWSEACEDWRASCLRSSTSPSIGDQAGGERLGGGGELLDLGGVARLGGLVGHEHGLLGVARDLLELLHGPVEAHLGLLLVGDDVGRLLPEAAVLVLRLGDRLLELDLRVGLRVEDRVDLRSEVLPPAPECLEHARRAYLDEAPQPGRRRRARLTSALASVTPMVAVMAEVGEPGRHRPPRGAPASGRGRR